jgi:hypothetical protein
MSPCPCINRSQWFRSTAVGIAALGLVLPASVFADDAVPATGPVPAGTPTAAKQTPQVLDVSLADGGALAGQVVDAQGLPLPETEVKVRSITGQAASSGFTDENGRFQIRGLAGGLYEVTAAQGSGAFRLWTAAASPPGAVKQVLLVAGQQVTRGQYLSGGQWFGGTGSLVGGTIILGSLGGIVAGAIITGLQQPSPSS